MEGDKPLSRDSLVRLVLFLLFRPATKATKISFVLLSDLCHGTSFFAPFWFSFSGVVIVSENESKVS